MIAAIIQARMSSTRLPGKVMMDIGGHPMIWHVVQRARQAELLDSVVVATSKGNADDPLVVFCEKSGIPCFRGSEQDVLDRYYQAAKWIKADVLVRITADCPLLDPNIVNDVIQYYVDGEYDYVSNVAPPTFPDGLDTEVFSFAALQRTWQEAKLYSEREHVTAYMRNQSSLFRTGNVEHKKDLSDLRWTVDEPQDLQFVRDVYDHLGQADSFGLQSILALLQDHPELTDLNRGFERNEGYQESLRQDKSLSDREAI